MKAFITKYALTQGILEMEANRDGDLIWVKGGFVGRDFFCSQYFHKGEWFLTKEEAIVKAEEMRQKKIKSLEKQLAKLKEMQFI